MALDLPFQFQFGSSDIPAETARMLADCRADLPGAIPSAMNAAYFSMLKDFLDFTNVWQEDIDVPLVAGSTAYVLTPLGNGRITRLLNLYDSQDANKVWVDRAEMRIPGALVIATVPSVTGPISVATCAKTAAEPAETDGTPLIDTWILEKYWDTLKAGILMRMMASPAKTYTNPQLAGLHGKIFMAGKTVARNESIKGNVRGQTNWRFPQTMGGGRQRGV